MYEQIMDFMDLAEKLKCNVRHSFTSNGRPESVAEHTFSLMVMVWLVKDEFPELDMNKVMEMCLFHDFGEAITGDIPSFDKTGSDELAESKAVEQVILTLPEKRQKRLRELFEEMEERTTKEARLYKALDKMDAVIQHNKSDLGTWIPIEYELQKIYGVEEAGEFPFVAGIRETVLEVTRKKTGEKNEV